MPWRWGEGVGGYRGGAAWGPEQLCLLAVGSHWMRSRVAGVVGEARTTMGGRGIHGGRRVNKGAPYATRGLDIRSVDPGRVSCLLRSVRAAMRDAVGEEGAMA